MTECEKIINGGILPECFFAEELLCDYLVTQERKKIWAISLDLEQPYGWKGKTPKGLLY